MTHARGEVSQRNLTSFITVSLTLNENVLYWQVVNAHTFETFRGMIDSLPSKTVPKAVGMVRCTLEKDLALGRTQPNEDTASILAFCRFLEGAIHSNLTLPQTMPMEHWTFYVKTVERLVTAEELPGRVKEEIEAAFHNVFCCIMA
jgi:hypothetical protein